MTKEDFTKRLETLGLSKKEFAEQATISYNTVNNWNNDTKPVPSWVDSWLENYNKAKNFKQIVEAVKPYM